MPVQVLWTHRLNSKMQCVGPQKMVCVRRREVAGEERLGEFVLALENMRNETGESSSDEHFQLNFYSVADYRQEKMVVIFHPSSGMCLSVTRDHTLQLRPLVNGHSSSNSVSGSRLQNISEADNMFFYVSRSGPGESTYVLKEAEGDRFLSATDEGDTLTLRQRPHTHNYPSDMRFSFYRWQSYESYAFSENIAIEASLLRIAYWDVSRRCTDRRAT